MSTMSINKNNETTILAGQDRADIGHAFDGDGWQYGIQPATTRHLGWVTGFETFADARNAALAELNDM